MSDESRHGDEGEAGSRFAVRGSPSQTDDARAGTSDFVRRTSTLPSPGFILWLTGLSGAGKSTLSAALIPHLEKHRRVELLDGDIVRSHLTQGLGFTRADRDTNVRRIAWVADLVARHGGIALCAVISPYRDVREQLKRTYANFVEVYVSATVEECARRDVKGLYARAIRGEIPHFTGVTDPYEPPTAADVVVETQLHCVEHCVDQVVAHLRSRGLL